MIVLFEFMACLLFGAAVANIWRFVKIATGKGIVVFAVPGKLNEGPGFPTVVSSVVRMQEYGVLTGAKVLATIATTNPEIATVSVRAM